MRVGLGCTHMSAKSHHVAFVIEIERIRFDIDRALVTRKLKRGERPLLAVAVRVVLDPAVASFDFVFADADCAALSGCARCAAFVLFLT